jgi:hypothetical protein
MVLEMLCAIATGSIFARLEEICRFGLVREQVPCAGMVEVRKFEKVTIVHIPVSVGRGVVTQGNCASFAGLRHVMNCRTICRTICSTPRGFIYNFPSCSNLLSVTDAHGVFGRNEDRAVAQLCASLPCRRMRTFRNLETLYPTSGSSSTIAIISRDHSHAF